jgi:DNA-binding NtrC family response regulator
MKAEIILCVDDDRTVLTALRDLLSRALGKSVLIEIVCSGIEALEFQQEVRSNGEEIALVISDYIMPRMNGDELLVQLHKLTPRTIKVMLTGQSDMAGVKRAINEAALYRFLEKPFNNADLVLTARSALDAYAQTLAMQAQKLELQQVKAHLQSLLAEFGGHLAQPSRDTQ